MSRRRLRAVATGRRIVTVTLNASLDKRYVVGSFVPGTVNRVRTCTVSAGGKGLNVARAAAIAGATVVATGLVAGHAGRAISDGIRADDVIAAFVEVPGESRSCVNLLDRSTGTTTELLEPGPTVDEAALEALRDRLGQLAEWADVVVLSGSAPPGTPQDVYARLARTCAAAGAPVLLDTSGPALRLGLAGRPAIIKPNADELAALAPAVGDRGSGGTEGLVTWCRALVTRARDRGPGARSVVVSRGADGAVLVDDRVALIARAPAVEAVNTVGCGDAMVAALALARAADLPPEQMLELAVAVGTAAAMSPGTGAFSPHVAEGLLDAVRARPAA